MSRDRSYAIERREPTHTRHTIPTPDGWTAWHQIGQTMTEESCRERLVWLRKFTATGWYQYRAIRLHKEVLPW